MLLREIEQAPSDIKGHAIAGGGPKPRIIRALQRLQVAPAERYCGYSEQRDEMAKRWVDDPPETLYSDWLQALRPLLARPDPAYPAWMRGTAYADKALTTVLASWSELRHDTILYVKQSYTAKRVIVGDRRLQIFDPKFYATVEPAPGVLLGLLQLSERTRATLAALRVLPEPVEQSLGQMEGLLGRLLAILEKQLTNAPRDRDDATFLMDIGQSFENLTVRLAGSLAPREKTDKPSSAGVEGLAEATRTTLVADVHTDLNTDRVLEEGVGPIRWLLAVDRNPDGSLSASVGPVFSHYEFVHRLDDRLTDEKWRELIRSSAAPPRTQGPLANGYQRFCTPSTPGCIL